MDIVNGPLRWVFPVLVGVAALEALILLLVQRHYQWRDSAASLAIAIGQRLLRIGGFGASAGLLAWAWTHRLWTVPLGGVSGWVLLFFASEFFYYWEHRASHEIRWMWATHAVHHSPTELNFSAAYRLGVTGVISGAGLFFLPLAWLGFAPVAIALVLALNLTYQFFLHTTLVPRLGPLEWILNTPHHHRAHHASNFEYLDRNYGGVLIIFDRLFGTIAKQSESITIRYGLVHPVNSFNPLVIAFHEWFRMGRDVWRARGWRQRLIAAFGRPGALESGPSGAPLPAPAASPQRWRTVALLAGCLGLLAASANGIAQTASRDAWANPARANEQGANPVAGEQSRQAPNLPPNQSPSQAMQQLRQRFEAADTDHDGRLTRAEALAGMPRVYRSFDAIDTEHKGYVTLTDIARYAAQQMAQIRAQNGAPATSN